MSAEQDLWSLLQDNWRDMLWPDDEFVVGWKTIEVIEGDDRRWSRADAVITQEEVSGNYYRWNYEHGLTEYQESELIDELPVRVYPHEKIIKTTEWSVQP